MGEGEEGHRSLLLNRGVRPKVEVGSKRSLGVVNDNSSDAQKKPLKEKGGLVFYVSYGDKTLVTGYNLAESH